MRQTILLVLCAALFPVLLPAQKKESKPAPAVETKVVTGALLLDEKKMIDAKALMSALKGSWKLKADSMNAGDKTIIFSTTGATVMIAYLDYPVAPAEIQAASRISWLWKTAAREAAAHKAQLVISVVGTSNRTLDLYRTFTKVAAAALENTTSSGVYMDGQYLLLPKGFYTAVARNMAANQTLPVYCWVYFGMVEEPGGNGGYTFGMQEFGLPEMEVVNSKRSIAEVHTVLYEAATQVLRNNTRLSDGQSIVTQEEEKVTARMAKSAHVQGNATVARFDY